MLSNMQPNLNIYLLQLMKNRILWLIPRKQINKSKKELQELKENFKKNMPANIKLSLDNYKKNVKRELMRLKEKKKFSKLKLEKLNA
jgi:hypothetical protein